MDNFFFYLSKIAWAIVAPDSLLIITLAVALLLLYRKQYLYAKWLLSFIFSALLLITIFPVDEWLLYPLENRYPNNPRLSQVDGIILLGGSVNTKRSYLWQQPVINNAAERDFAFIKLIKQYPNAKAIYTGGNSSLAHQPNTEADVAKQLLASLGLDISTILFENRSRNTWENAKYSKILPNVSIKQNWILITSAWHMPRAMGVFRQQGWQVTPYPVDFRTKPTNLLRVEWRMAQHLTNLKIAVKEWLGISVYIFTGKMDKF